jgi:hypothetical protein
MEKMMSIRELDMARVRIKRAHDNIREFAEVVDEYIGRHPAYLAVDLDDEGHGSLRAVRSEPLPIELPILLGEALQNLRAGLDNCLYAVAIIDSGQNPPPGETKLQWPIALSPKEWKENKKRLENLSPHLIAALHRIQPFQAEWPEWNCLRILHDLARLDRHRSPHELCMWLEEVTGTYDKAAIHDLAVKEGPVGEGGVLVTFTKLSEEELNRQMLNLHVILGIEVQGLELSPHPETGVPSRPWGPLENRLRGMCKAAEEYAEGLVYMAQNPGAWLSVE